MCSYLQLSLKTKPGVHTSTNDLFPNFRAKSGATAQVMVSSWRNKRCHPLFLQGFMSPCVICAGKIQSCDCLKEAISLHLTDSLSV